MSLSFIAVIFLLPRIRLCWRTTTGDPQSACFENQDFLLTCQRKWRKRGRDETHWRPQLRDKPLSRGQAGSPRVNNGRKPAGCASCLRSIVVDQRGFRVNYSSPEPRISPWALRGPWTVYDLTRAWIISSPQLSHSSVSMLCFVKALSFMLATLSSHEDPNNKYLPRRNTGDLKLELRLVRQSLFCNGQS